MTVSKLQVELALTDRTKHFEIVLAEVAPNTFQAFTSGPNENGVTTTIAIGQPFTFPEGTHPNDMRVQVAGTFVRPLTTFNVCKLDEDGNPRGAFNRYLSKPSITDELLARNPAPADMAPGEVEVLIVARGKTEDALNTAIKAAGEAVDTGFNRGRGKAKDGMGQYSYVLTGYETAPIATREY